MKREINIQATIDVYTGYSELPEKVQKLLQLAKNQISNAYAPYSNFQVAAALLLSNGEMIAGTNQENAAYPMCLCAERVAIGAAHAQYPGISIETIFITVKSKNQKIDQPAAPCGACRQVICELEHRFNRQIEIYLQGEVGPIYKFKSGRDMLPLSFDSSFL